MIKSFYPSILANNKDLSLGEISLQYQHVNSIPCLLTIYELKKPLLQAYYEIKNIVVDLEHNKNSDYAIKGLFVLGIAYFEIMHSDLLAKFIKFFPEKISVLRSTNGTLKSEKKEFHLSQEMINRGNITQSIIEQEVNKLMYSNIRDITNSFYSILSIDSEKMNGVFDIVNEIKETRNLLLHNNLRVNSYYLNNTKKYSRAVKMGELLSISKEYATSSMELLLELTADVIQKIEDKYKKYTLLNLLKRLWRYTFENESIKIEDFCVLNNDKDSIDGPFNTSDYLSYLSSSEIFFWDMWRSQRMGNLLNLRLVGLDKNNIAKTAFLVEVFGELRFPHWSK